MTFQEFVKKWSHELSAACEKVSKPQYNMDYSKWAPQFQDFTRPLMPAQIHTVGAIVTRFQSADDCLLVGENGVGKSAAAIAASSILKSKTILIICPPHLTEKWAREIRLTLGQFNAGAHHISNITDMNAAMERIVNSNIQNFFIISRESAKLSAGWKWALNERWEYNVVNGRLIKNRMFYRCPTCGDKIVAKPKKDEEVSVHKIITTEDLPVRKVKHCDISPTSCQAPLWQYTRNDSGNVRWSLAEYIKKKIPKSYFDLLIIDEAHQFKGSDSSQGIAFGILASRARKTIALTGTVFGGYSSTLFYLLFRLCRDVKKKFTHNAIKEWVSQFGFNETTRKMNTKTNKVQSVTKETPGIMPAIFNLVIDKTAFLHLQDLEYVLPTYTERNIAVHMSADQKIKYSYLENIIREKLQALRTNKNVKHFVQHLSGLQYLHTLTTYPLLPGQDAIRTDGDGVVVKLADGLDPKNVYPLEQNLIDIVKQNKQNNRKVLIYSNHTHIKNVAGRITDVMRNAGIKVEYLSANIQAKKRESHINKIVSDIDAMVCNPKLVETGLDLLDFPTIIFVEPEYSIYTLRQSSRRSWRIGQKKPVEVCFMYYKETVHETAYSLIAKKMRASVVIDGEIIDPHGLSGIEFNEDITAQVIDCLVRNVRMNTFEKELQKTKTNLQQQNGFIDMGNSMYKVPSAPVFTGRTTPAPIVQPLNIFAPGEQMKFDF